MSSIGDFYKGRSVLVTGGTGFMGKVLIEKLLYSVPDIGNIYILMRPKKGKSVAQRMDDIQRLPGNSNPALEMENGYCSHKNTFRHPSAMWHFYSCKITLFNRLKHERPSALQKIKPIHGDVLCDHFGLADTEIEILSNEVSVLFHFAATLKMEAPLKDCVDMNTCGTVRALNIARRLKKLDIFVHLSTAFCYPDYQVLGEKTYAPPVNPENIMRVIQWMDDKQLAVVSPTLLGLHPNCYTFSKRLAENVVEDAYKDLPLVIARPSIVCPAYKEPIPGWVDSLNGPVGVMLGAGKGVIRTMLVDGSLRAEVIPVDIAINAIIAIAMLEAKKEEKSATVPVYNVNIGHQKPTTWGDVLNLGKQYGRKRPLEWPLWYPNGDITTNRFRHQFKRLFYHLLPAYLIDSLMFMLGQKRFMVRIQGRISQGLEVLQYFTMRPWHFPCPKYDSIQDQLQGEDKVVFNTDITDADSEQYIQQSVEGGRIFCLKEDPLKVPYSLYYHNFLYVLDWIMKIMFWLLFLSFLARWFEPVRELFSYGSPVFKYLPFLGATVFKE